MATSNNGDTANEVSNAIITLPNLISFVRLCMVPAFFVLFLRGYNIAATVLFSVAAATDFLDGQIARRTHTVTKLGQILDPAVDRALMIFGVLGLLIVGRLPMWIVVVVLARDLFLLSGGYYLLKRWKQRVPVVFAGKFATTCLFIGFAGLVLNMPLIHGLGITAAVWLPGFNASMCSWGIWFVYAGLVIDIFTTIYYIRMGFAKAAFAKALEINRQPTPCDEGQSNLRCGLGDDSRNGASRD